MHTADVDEPLRLPAAPTPAGRPALPLAAAIVPVVGAVVLWLVTGSAYALWFAALGPLMAVAAFADGVRTSRRSVRRARREVAASVRTLGDDLDRRQADERQRQWRRTPDVAGYARDADEVWRAVPGRGEVVVVGSGDATSTVRLDGEAHDDATRALRRRARTAPDMPVVVPLTAGIAVAGPPIAAAAVVRALVMQLCLALPPGGLRLLDEAPAPAPAGLPRGLPHAAATGGAALFVGNGDRPIPAIADVPIVRVAEGAPPPPRCAAVLTLEGPDRARLDHDGRSQSVRVEAVSTGQARALAVALDRRAATLGHGIDAPVTLDDLLDPLDPSVPSAGSPASLAAPIGVGGGEPVLLDLVSDGPHAVVIGVTGSGKSELLTTWIAGMCRGRTPQQLALLLVDFKGGRTFDALEGLPHVTGVLTDLDEAQAVRAVESLRAEIRYREQALAAVGARDIGEAGGVLGRLVIVVDEYAALVAARPELHDLFADVAARGRALGMHLVLASQRAAGGFRDGVLANAPLRIAFRVTDAADSRAILGQDDAARLSGASGACGLALVRRAVDSAPWPVRVARCGAATLESLRAQTSGLAPARRPWMPPLPARVPIAALRHAVPDGGAPGIVLGLADEPENQRQSVVVRGADIAGIGVIGGAGSGRTTLLRVIAAQSPQSLWVGSDPETAWDAVARIAAAPAGTVVLIDDADVVAARLTGDYAVEWAGALDRIAREARGRGILVVMSVSRVAGALGRAFESLPERIVLPTASRADHVAAGGEAADFALGAGPGRGRWRRRLVQFAALDDEPGPDVEAGLGAGTGAVAAVAASALGASVPASGVGSEIADPAPSSRARRRAGRRGEVDGAIPPAPRWRPGGPTAIVAPVGTRLDRVRTACEAAGARCVSVEDAAAAAVAFIEPVVVIGAPEAWLAQWRLLSAARAAAELIVDAGCAAEFRAVTGIRELPPYVLPGADRAWSIDRGGPPRRIVLPGR